MIVKFYEKRDGEKPVLDFIEGIDEKMQIKVIGVIKLLEEKGSLLREPYSRKISDGLYALRARQGSNIVRVLYFFCEGDKAVLTNGFVKKSQKTPRKEIETAYRYRRDHLAERNLL